MNKCVKVKLVGGPDDGRTQEVEDPKPRQLLVVARVGERPANYVLGKSNGQWVGVCQEHGIEPCNTCRWFVRHSNGSFRCHAEPPRIRWPYENLSAWPIVPVQGGGCGLHQTK